MTHISNESMGGTIFSVTEATRLEVPSVRGPPRQARQSDVDPGLLRAVEVEIVPRLILAHNATGASPLPILPPQPTPGDSVARFAEIILTQDTDAACAFVERLRDQGLSLDRIYLELLAPTAHHLRSLWSTDVCDFAEVTLALWKLQQVLRDFSAAFRSDFDHREHGLRVLLTPAPGERQEIGYVMFGLVMIAEFFRREGWDAWIEPDASSKEFSDLIHNQDFDVVEFLVSGDKRLDSLAACIRNVRRESSNGSVGVMVCGPAFTENPELVLMVGADVMSSDPKQGTVQAKKLVALLASRG